MKLSPATTAALLCLLTSLVMPSPGHAADKVIVLDPADAMMYYRDSDDYVDGVNLHFKGVDTAPAGENLGDHVVTLRTTQKKSLSPSEQDIYLKGRKDSPTLENDVAVCLFLFARVAGTFARDALATGASDIADITAQYRNKPVVEDGQIRCYRGMWVSGLGLRGLMVRS